MYRHHLVKLLIGLISFHSLNALWFQLPTAWSYCDSMSWCFWQERDPNIFYHLVVEFKFFSNFKEYLVPDKMYYSWMTLQELMNHSWLCFLESRKQVKCSIHNYIGDLQDWRIQVFTDNHCLDISNDQSPTIWHLTWPSNQCIVQNNKHILLN